MNISKSTLKNWKRLNSDSAAKLRSGANKSSSKKRIYPVEYIRNSASLTLARHVVSVCGKMNIAREDAVFTLAVKYLDYCGILQKKSVQTVLSEYDFSVCGAFDDIVFPQDEFDILGFIYQCLLSEGEKNASGAYYTAPDIVLSMMEKSDFSQVNSFFDPCCGSGAFLLAFPAADPNMLRGCDRDPLAVLIAKVNLLCKYREFDFIPNIFCCDYLKNTRSCGLPGKFDLIVTNPPWGAVKSGTKKSEDSFSLFFRKAVRELSPGGRVDFLLPESVLHVKTHSSLRRFMAEECTIEMVRRHPGNFTGVMTGYVDITVSNRKQNGSFLFCDGSSKRLIPHDELKKSRNYEFNFVGAQDKLIIDKMKQAGKYDLSRSIFALGIVTGDNKNKVKTEQLPGMEPIFTGKDVTAYRMKEPSHFLEFAPQNFQQCASEEVYRSKEKLIYRFVSKKLLFALDTSGTLSLNSANILIPDIPGMSTATVMAFLNSAVLNFYYNCISHDLKVLKSRLIQLPFPEISPEQDRHISDLTASVTAQSNTELQKLTASCYGLSDSELEYITSATV